MKIGNTTNNNELVSRAQADKGFTLVELLVAIAVLGVLAGLAIKAFDTYKIRAYDAIADGTFSQTRAALEAAKIDSETFPERALTSTNTGPGVPEDEDGELLLPGLVIPRDVRVFVFHEPGCRDGGCVEDVIQVRHCRSNRAISYSYLKNFGTVLNRNAEPGEGC